MKVCRVSIATPAPTHEALARFWDMERLQAFWEPISRVTTLYDDGRHQEALMSVQRAGQEERIRILRFKAGTDILFFNPRPPPMMSSHRGAWRFTPHGDEGCTITAEREYELLRQSGESDEAYARRADAFDLGLRDRLRQLLETFRASVPQAPGGTSTPMKENAHAND